MPEIIPIMRICEQCGEDMHHDNGFWWCGDCGHFEEE